MMNLEFFCILLVPDKPQQLSFEEPSQVTNSNRKRWKYTVTWQVIKSLYLQFLHCKLVSYTVLLQILLKYY